MNNIFIEILNMSISAGFVIASVALIRLFIKKVPKKYAYALWAVAFFRLAFPFVIEMPVSAVPVQPQTIPQSIVSFESPAFENTGDVFVPIVPENPTPESLENTNNSTTSTEPTLKNPIIPVTTKETAKPTNLIETILSVSAIIWIVGVVTFLTYAVINYLIIKRNVGTAIRVRDEIYETDLIKTPFVLGFIRPKIYIPLGIDKQELTYIIEHERVHIKRRDYLIKPIAFLITVLHWFNPLAWIAYMLMARDMELSADEYVMKTSGVDIRKDYSGLLLNISTKKSGLISPLAFGETSVKTRVANVLNYKKPRQWISKVALFIVVLSTVLLVGSMAASNDEDGDTDLPVLSDIYDGDTGESLVITDENDESNIIDDADDIDERDIGTAKGIIVGNMFYKDIEVASIFEKPLREVLGEPIRESEPYLYYDDFCFVGERWNPLIQSYDNTIFFLSVDHSVSLFTINGVTLNKTRNELIEIFGDPVPPEETYFSDSVHQLFYYITLNDVVYGLGFSFIVQGDIAQAIFVDGQVHNNNHSVGS